MIEQKKLKDFVKTFYQRNTFKDHERFMVIALDKSVLAYGNGGALVDVDRKNKKLYVKCDSGVARAGISWEDLHSEEIETFDEDEEEDMDKEACEDDFIIRCDDDGEKFSLPDYRFHGLFYHVTKSGKGIRIKEDYSSIETCIPAVFWNSGTEDIYIGNKALHPGEHRVILPDHPLRAKPREERKAAFDWLLAQSEEKIRENEIELLSMGCPEADVKTLAAYFWRNEIHPSRYGDKPHAEWMQDVWDEAH